VRGKLGKLEAGDFDLLPPELRFFAGGDRSIRGFGYEEIGSRNEVGDVIGGDQLVEASGELEYYWRRNLGAAIFVDAGDAFLRRSREDVRDGDITALEIRSRRDQARADELIRGDLASPFRECVPIASHIANAGHAIRDVERKESATADDRRVDVHVPQAGQQERSPRVDDARAGGRRRGSRRSNGGDPRPTDDDGLIRARL